MTEWQVPYICITKPTNTHSSISMHLPFQYYASLHLLETFTSEHNPPFFYINFSYPMAHYLGIQIHLHHTSLKKPAIIQFLYSLFTWKLDERVVSIFSTSMLFSSYCNQFSSTEIIINVTKILHLTMFNYLSSSYYTSQRLTIEHPLSYHFVVVVSIRPFCFIHCCILNIA